MMDAGFSKGLWLYRRKARARNDEAEDRYRRTLMMMDWTARCLTGQDTKLTQEFESRIKPAAAETPKEKTKEQRIKEEEELLGQFSKIGIKVKEK